MSITDSDAYPTPDLTHEILRMLRERGFAEGDRIPTEAEISQTFAASRQRVRESLRQLEVLGIVNARQGSGRVIASKGERTLAALLTSEVERTPADVLNLLAVRQVLEVGFLPAAIAAADSNFDRIAAALASMQRCIEQNQSFARYDREFHQAIFAPVGNPILQGLIGRFWDLFAEFDEDQFHHHETPEAVVKHHEEILDAISRQDPGRAQFHMNAHFYDVAQILTDAVQEKADPPSPEGGSADGSFP